MRRQRMETLFYIGMGGFVGANLRYFLSGWIADHFGQAFPWGTLIINVTGSILLGILISWSGNRIEVDPRIRLFLAVGFFGAFTTYSTYANESVALLQSGDWTGALGNVLSTNLLCLIGAMIGVLIGGRW